MKKVLIALVLAMLLVCTACGGNPSEQPETVTVQEAAVDMPQSAQAWVSLLHEKLPFDDQMSETDRAAAIYGILDEDGYTGDAAMLISTMATPEEIAVFQADTVYSAQALCELAQARLAQQKASYASYAPQEVPKLESAVVKVCGEYVIVCVCADNTLAEQIIEAVSR